MRADNAIIAWLDKEVVVFVDRLPVFRIHTDKEMLQLIGPDGDIVATYKLEKTDEPYPE